MKCFFLALRKGHERTKAVEAKIQEEKEIANAFSRTLKQSYLQIRKLIKRFAKQLLKLIIMKSFLENQKVRIIGLGFVLACVFSGGIFLQN
jgi:hypothetical protein